MVGGLVLLLLGLGGVGGRLLVLVTEGFPGFAYYKYSQQPGFRRFEAEGAWSDFLYPEFPTYALPNLHSLATGKIPSGHGIVGEYMFDASTSEYFMGGFHENDYALKWWNRTEPIWVTATRQGLKTALLHWPGCQVPWSPPPALCVELRLGDAASGLRPDNVEELLEATRSHDFVLAYHRAIGQEAERKGPSDLMNNRSAAVGELGQMLSRVLSHSDAQGDLNVLVVSERGLTAVPHQNRRFLEDYLDMSLVRMTVGRGAVKQIIPAPGMTHTIFSSLRRENPIPNVKVYYTTARMSDLPEWYGYSASDRVPPLVLVAQPGFAVLSKDPAKQVPIPQAPDFGWRPALGGYNNNYPEMLGLFLAHGPGIRRGYRKGPAHLLDVHPLMCRLLGLDCPAGDGNLSSIADVLPAVSRAPPASATIMFILSLFSLLLLLS